VWELSEDSSDVTLSESAKSLGKQFEEENIRQ